MSKAILKSEGIVSLNESKFITEGLRENLRVDGRRPHDMRRLNINFDSGVTGHVEVQLGGTRVLTSVRADIVEPFPERPTEGFFHFNVEFSPMADPNFEQGKQSDQFIELGRVVERGLRESRAIDSEALCIIASEKVWSVRCDIHILDHVGNLTDCASIATIAALMHFRRPSTTVTGSQVTVHPPGEKEPVPLSIHHFPVCITFGFFEENGVTVLDPHLKEELIMDGQMTLTLNSHREICSIQKAGGTAVSMETLSQCLRIAAVKVLSSTYSSVLLYQVEEITGIIQKALEEDAAKRRKLRS
ncbi:hypothetical protein PROFUN_13330 [Planoprotostelium fungivorum]|uniref:Exosome complex component RRP45 n=1 Tax=Planoprotostelium fungivorum TaxID=1890364 RepID=A0A2P6N4M7_9EUKA|nr:hypothetical protein PROFUN_13330 [Planoprotostelium fungivorum]